MEDMITDLLVQLQMAGWCRWPETPEYVMHSSEQLSLGGLVAPDSLEVLVKIAGSWVLAQWLTWDLPSQNLQSASHQAPRQGTFGDYHSRSSI